MLSNVFDKVRSLFGFEVESRKRRLENTDSGESSSKKIRRIDRPLAFSNYFSGNLPSLSDGSKPDGRPQLPVREDPDLMFPWDKKNPGKENHFSWNSGSKELDADVVVLGDDYVEQREIKSHRRSSHFKSHMPSVRRVSQMIPSVDIEEVNRVGVVDEDVMFVKESSKQDVCDVFPSKPHSSLHSGRKSHIWTSSVASFMDNNDSKERPKNKLDGNFPFFKSGQKSLYGLSKPSFDQPIHMNRSRGTGDISRLDSPSVKNRIRNGNLSRAAILKKSLPPPPPYFGAEPKMSSRWSGLDDNTRKKTSALSLYVAIDEMKAYNHMLQKFTSESASKSLMTRLDGQAFKMFESQLKRNYSYSQLLKKRIGGKTGAIVDTIDLCKSDDDAQEVECLDEARSLVPPRKELRDCAIVHPTPRRVDVQRSREVTPKTSGEVGVNEKPFLRKSPNAVEQMIKKSHVTNEEFLRDIMDRYANEKHKISKELEREKLKKQVWSERRQMFEETLEERLKRYMKITEVVLDDVADTEQEEKLPELTKDMLNTVHEALRKGRSCVLARLGSNTITGADIQTLADSNWLNDEVINNYMDMLTQRGQANDYPSVYCFNTFFYPRLSSSGYASVKRWTKKVDIFQKEMVIIPLHLEIHWALAVVDFRQETICYYDSMNSPKSYILEVIRRYLQDERMDKKKEKYDLSHWNVKLIQDIPQQRNGHDCGVFACMFAEHLSRGIVKGSKSPKGSVKCSWSYPPFPFSQDNMPYFRKRMMYEILTGKILQ